MINSEKLLKCAKETVIHIEGELTLFKITTNSQRFNDVISLREEHSDDVVDLYDDNASIYVIYQQNSPIGTTRVIEARTSELDFERALPFKIEERFRQFICSTSRLAITQRQNVPKSVINFLLGVTAQDQLRQGTRFDLIVCRERLISYYRKIGHQVLSYPPIIHPRTGVSCHLMLWLPTLTHTRFANQYFAHLQYTLEVEAFEFLKKFEGDPSQLLLDKKVV